MSSSCSVGDGTKLAGFDKQGILYMVQLSSQARGERTLSMLKFNPITQFVDVAAKVVIFHNQPIDQTTFHVCTLSQCGNYLGVYVQYSETGWFHTHVTSWFLEINLNNFEVKRNPCSFPKLNSQSCQLIHTDTRWGWILCGYPVSRANGEFEFHSFQSGIGEGYSNEYFKAFLLTVATCTSINQRFGVVDDKLYSIHLSDDNSWNFNFFDLNNSSNSNWNGLKISKTSSDDYPLQISRLFCVDRKLCALEIDNDMHVIRMWKVEKGRSGAMAQWNLWKSKETKRLDSSIINFILSPKLFLTQHLIAFEIFEVDEQKKLESSIQVFPLDVPSLRYISAKKSFEHLSRTFDEERLKNFFKLSAKCGLHKFTLGTKLHILSRLRSESDSS